MVKNVGEIRSFLLDMDGTINLGQQLLPGAKEFIDYLQSSGREFLFLTNNSSKDADHYVKKMCRLGISCSTDNVLTSGDATVSYLQSIKPGARIFLMGTPELEQAFIAGGFCLTDEAPDFVVLGFDMTLTYAKLVKGCDFIRQGICYIATHPDFNCPVENGYIPDTGAMIELIKASTGKVPKIIGKPNKEIIESAFRKLSLSDTFGIAIVGDRVYTDIKTGENAGIDSILVLSGESEEADLKRCGVTASFVFNGVGDICQELKEYDRVQAQPRASRIG